MLHAPLSKRMSKTKYLQYPITLDLMAIMKISDLSPGPAIDFVEN